MSRQGVNSVTILGNLGQDPELQETKSGMAVASFSVAVNQSVKVGEGYEDRVEWLQVTVFGRRAEVCAQYLFKGAGVFVEGKLSTRSWVDESNVKRWSTTTIARNIIFLDSKGQGQKSDRPPAPPQEDTEDGMTAKPEDGSQAGGYDASEESGGEYKKTHGGAKEYEDDVPF